jgi:hypothetical protein
MDGEEMKGHEVLVQQEGNPQHPEHSEPAVQREQAQGQAKKELQKIASR